jgi:hypothetical protein
VLILFTGGAIFIYGSLRGRVMVTHRPHNPELAGSIPAPATTYPKLSLYIIYICLFSFTPSPYLW